MDFLKSELKSQLGVSNRQLTHTTFHNAVSGTVVVNVRRSVICVKRLQTIWLHGKSCIPYTEESPSHEADMRAILQQSPLADRIYIPWKVVRQTCRFCLGTKNRDGYVLPCNICDEQGSVKVEFRWMVNKRVFERFESVDPPRRGAKHTPPSTLMSNILGLISARSLPFTGPGEKPREVIELEWTEQKLDFSVVYVDCTFGGKTFTTAQLNDQLFLDKANSPYEGGVKFLAREALFYLGL